MGHVSASGQAGRVVASQFLLSSITDACPGMLTADNKLSLVLRAPAVACVNVLTMPALCAADLAAGMDLWRL